MSSREYKYDAFLTHDWGVPPDNHRDNHACVRLINDSLTSMGTATWFDAEKMEKNVLQEMASGISLSRVVVVFVTRRYIHKVNGDNANDNCKLEFLYAMGCHSPAKIVSMTFSIA
jgi:TIR domain